LIIGKKQKEGLERFDKGFHTLWGILSLTPTFSIGTDIVDVGLSAAAKDSEELKRSYDGAASKAFYSYGNTIDPKKAKNFTNYKKAVLTKIFSKLFGATYALPDIVDDGKDLYDNITE
jgi:hypothetical protein